jgi:ligand-binding sensor domain-containing protein/signal transduction histidine kinase
MVIEKSLHFSCLHTGVLPALLLACGIVRADPLPPAVPPNGMDGFYVRVWQMEDRLPNNIVQAITQTRDGYLWIGTRAGAARFDGLTFTPLELLPNAAEPSVLCLCAAKDGSLWLGTEERGLYHLHNGRLSHYGKDEGLPSDTVTQVQETSDGSVWIGLYEGVAQLRNGEIRFPAVSSATANPVLSLCAAPGGGVWVGAARGVQKCQDQKVSTFRTAGSQPLRAIRALAAQADDSLWIGTSSGLVLLKDNVPTRYAKGEGPSAIISALLCDSAGNLWVGTFSGLSRFVDGRFTDEMEVQDAAYRIYALYEDREGSVWVGSEAGLARLTPKHFRTYTTRQGLSGNTVASVCATRDGGIWIGTWGGGLDEIKDGRITVYDKTTGLSSDFVVAIQEGKDGRLLLGTEYERAIGRLEQGHMTPFPVAPAQLGLALTTLIEDHEGNLWVGSREGLGCFKDGTFIRYTAQNGLADSKVNALCEAADGSLWIGTQGGLTRWKDGRFSAAVDGPYAHAAVLSLYEDPKGTVWIGTRGAGLGRLSHGKLEVFTRRQGLLSDSIYSILEDNFNHLWFNSSMGIFRVSKTTLDKPKQGKQPALDCISFGRAEGILSSGQSWPPWYQFDLHRDGTQPAACKGADGRLWFQASQGVTVVDPGKVKPNRLPPPVVIEEVIADRQPVSNPRLEGPSSNAAAATLDFASQTLKIPPGSGDLEVHYTALSLRAPEKNRFRYKLDGVDRDWVDAGDRRAAYYSHLAPGSYAFRVTACNNDGAWNSTGAVVRLKLQPHFWQTWLFLSLCATSCAGMIGGTTLYVTRKRMQRKLERLEQRQALEEERARIARDMHDELGAKLTFISFQGAMALRSLDNTSQTEQQIQKMTQTARALVGSLDEIVWAVDPENDSLENLANYICRYTEEFFENSPIACEFSIPADLPDCRVAADVRHTVFLAVKEALNNILKHSQARHVEIQLKLPPAMLEILISDDGKGLPPAPLREAPAENPGRAGHGLRNLRDRLAAIKGRCDIVSKPHNGTQVRLLVPLSFVHTTIPPSDSAR